MLSVTNIKFAAASAATRRAGLTAGGGWIALVANGTGRIAGPMVAGGTPAWVST
jgi:hypothetical protein